jgi:hypothetical protein
MTKREIIDLIAALAQVVEANKGWLGSETLLNEANEKIRELMKLI